MNNNLKYRKSKCWDRVRIKNVILLLILIIILTNCNDYKSKSKSNHENCIILDSNIRQHGKSSIFSSKVLALKVGELYLKATYGNSKINEQMPLKIETYCDSLWKIFGTYQRKDSTKFYIGGCADIILSKVDGKVISITHGK